MNNQKINIGLFGVHLYNNLGSPSLILGFQKIIENTCLKNQVKYNLFSYMYKYDKDMQSIYNVEIYPVTLKALFSSLFGYKQDIVNNIAKQHIMIDIRGIGFTDYFPSMLGYIEQCAWILISKSLKKPVIKFTQDLGPFNYMPNKIMSKFCLNKLDAIFVRSKKSFRNLKLLKIWKVPIYIKPDTALILDEYRCDWKINGSYVVIVPSRQLDRRMALEERINLYKINSYNKMLANIIEDITKKYNIKVVLLPNEIAVGSKYYDDVYVIDKILSLLKGRFKNNIIIIKRGIDPYNIRCLMKFAELAIVSRYHSLVAALSMETPAIAIGWGFKYKELLSLFGFPELSIGYKEIRKINSAYILNEKLEYIIKNKNRIRKKVKRRLTSIKKTILDSTDILLPYILESYESEQL